jgi:hypothetical protein
MQSTIQSDLLGGGFMDRCIWVYREPVFQRRKEQSIVSAMPKDPLAAEMLAEWIINNILSKEIKVPVIFTKEAEERHAEFHLALVEDEELEYRTYGADSDKTSANRLDWATVQVASLLSLSEGEFPPVYVELRHLEQAIELVMAEEDSMARFMGEAYRRKDVKVETQIMKFVEDHGGCARLSDLTKHFSRFRSSKSTRAYLEGLIDQDRLNATTLAVGSGRRPLVYRIKGHACARCSVEE